MKALQMMMAVIVVPLCLTLFSGVGRSQEQAQSTSRRECCSQPESFKRVSGWTIPGLASVGRDDVGGRTQYKNAPEGVYATALNPKIRQSKLTLIEMGNCRQVTVLDVDVAVEHLTRLDYQGQIFGYVAVTHFEGVAGGSIVVFYDMEGNGKYTVMTPANDPDYKLRIPEWVKTRSTVKSQ